MRDPRPPRARARRPGVLSGEVAVFRSPLPASREEGGSRGVGDGGKEADLAHRFQNLSVIMLRPE